MFMRSHSQTKFFCLFSLWCWPTFVHRKESCFGSYSILSTGNSFWWYIIYVDECQGSPFEALSNIQDPSTGKLWADSRSEGHNSTQRWCWMHAGEPQKVVQMTQGIRFHFRILINSFCLHYYYNIVHCSRFVYMFLFLINSWLPAMILC